MTPDRAEVRAKELTETIQMLLKSGCKDHAEGHIERQLLFALRAVAQDCAEVARQHRVQSFGKVTIKELEELLDKETSTPIRIEPSGEVRRICQCNEQIETAIRARWGVQ